jgi:release factor glutamine methyltransferase
VLKKIQELLKQGYDILKNENIDSYMLDTQLLLGKVLKMDRMAIITNRDLLVEDEMVKAFVQLIELRKTKMPVKYILKSCEFMGFEFYIESGVLIPRPDTEVLVEEVLREAKSHNYTKICDVCCGSGVIGISIAKLLAGALVDCADISEYAEKVTKENIKRLKAQQQVNFYKSDLLQYALEQDKTFQVIVSNPPYISTEVIPTLMEDVKDYEPYIALCGGKDGLDFYRKITMQSLKVLDEGGLLAYEIGYDQGEAVQNILKDNGFKDIRCVKDLAENDRVILGFMS